MLKTAPGSIHATLANGDLWRVSLATGREQRISLGALRMSLAVSPNGKLTAVGTDDGELFVVRADDRIAVHTVGRGAVECTAFEDDRTLLACVPGSRIVRLAVTDHSFSATP